MSPDTSTSAVPPEPAKEKPQATSDEARAASPNTAPPVAATGSVASTTDAPKVDVSAGTITRMMGIASTSDLRLLEGRIDLLTAKVSGLMTKVDRVVSMFGSTPSASDIDRLEIQIGTLKGLIKEVLEVISLEADKRALANERVAAQDQSRKLREGIKSSEE
jgi:hypothetical protein